MDRENFTIQVSFVSFSMGTLSALTWLVLGMNNNAMFGLLVWLMTALVTLSLSRHFYFRHRKREKNSAK